MAVAVDATSVLVLDEEYRVVEVSPALQAGFGLRPGRSTIDGLPGSRSLFVPYCEHARRTGEPVEFAQYYGGAVAAPVFSAVMAGALRTLAVPPDAPVDSELPPPDAQEIKEEV